MTTGKTFVSKVTSLLFNMLFRFVIAFLSRSRCILKGETQEEDPAYRMLCIYTTLFTLIYRDTVSMSWEDVRSGLYTVHMRWGRSGWAQVG